MRESTSEPSTIADDIDVRVLIDDEEGGEAHYFLEGGKWNAEETSHKLDIALPQTNAFSGLLNPPENRAKNQIAATPAEVAGESHTNADWSELLSFHNHKALGERVSEDAITPEIRKLTMTAGWRRTFKGEGEHRKPKSRLYVRGLL